MKTKRPTNYDRYLDDVELWESRKLGASAKHAKLAPQSTDKALDDALGLEPISLRLQKDLVQKLRVLAKEEGLGYQTYIRQILTRHARKATKPAKKKKTA
jgi:uncharacterized protein (DUF4415 family)